MPSFKTIKHFLLGKPRDPFSKQTHSHIALVAFFAWVGLGADGLSSSCYGPAEAFIALEGHTSLGIYLAIATAVTVFIISVAYIQVLELFPGGGGGYRVASSLLGSYAGLISGSALVIDYVLTIAISVAGGVDALFSMMPVEALRYALPTKCAMIFVLVLLNLRGMKESIKILMPIFLGFVITHVGLIVYGIAAHVEGLPNILPKALAETTLMSKEMGALMVASFFLKAFSLGGGTYTGLESVSNNVNTLAEPRVKTGKVTMVMIAFSLAFTAGGIILLYLLWGAVPEEGKTLNAVVFGNMMEGWTIGGVTITPYTLGVVMALEAGLLLVAANTGFLAGPSVLANMASDQWMPHFFSSLSSRLVTKNGITIMGAAAFVALLVTAGDVGMLVVLYSINVFLTFSLSLLGLMRYWIRYRKQNRAWKRKLFIATVGFIVCASILVITTLEKFHDGGWMTILITGALAFTGWAIHRSYGKVRQKLALADELFADAMKKTNATPPALDPSQQTAVFIVNSSLGSGMHALLWVLRLFPGVYKNFVFISVGEVDSGNFLEREDRQSLRRDVKRTLSHYVNYCHSHGMAATSYVSFGTDVVDRVGELIEKVLRDFPKAVFFSSKLIFQNESFFTQYLYNQNSYIIQRRLHNQGHNMIILPMRM